jgi:hypothetical protein
MTRIRDLLIAISRRWWAVVLVFVLNFAAFTVLFALEDQFEALAGVPTFDTQNDLTAARLIEQLPLYQGEARAAYMRFIAFDFVFPFVAALFIAVLWTLFLRLNTWKIAVRLLAVGTPLFAFIGTLWDYLENVSLLTILNTGASQTWIDLALMFKGLKLTWLFLNAPITAVILGLLIANVIYRVLRARQHRKQNAAVFTP